MFPLRRILSAVLLLTASAAFAGAPPQPPQKPQLPASLPKAIDMARPMAWLIDAQGKDGGWGTEKGAPEDVATTAIAVVALLRYGNTMASGPHADSLRRGVEYVIRAIDAVPSATLEIQAEGTQPQRKLGRYIDTYLAAQVLGEVSPTVQDPADRHKVSGALDKVIGKVMRLQRQDGSFEGQGWAPVLSSAFAHGGLYAAKAAGSRVVTQDAITRANANMEAQYDARKKSFESGNSAGVQLYSAAGALGAAGREGKMDGDAAKAARELVKDEAFLRGFGTYGGEEHVSYMMTSEALSKVGGDEWKSWDKNIRTRLAYIQRADGTWRGDHCITSTTFCTAASLVTLAIKAAPTGGGAASGSP
jgi:hypothetical protein